MWNSFNTGDYSGMIAETISLAGHGGKNIRAYYSRPITDKATPGIVLIPHMPGWDEWCRETCRRFTEHGYSVLCPDIYQDFGTGTPPEVSKRMWEAGGALDSSVMEEWTEATFKTENYEKVGLKLKTEFGELLPEFIKMDRELFGDHLSS